MEHLGFLESWFEILHANVKAYMRSARCSRASLAVLEEAFSFQLPKVVS